MHPTSSGSIQAAAAERHMAAERARLMAIQDDVAARIRRRQQQGIAPAVPEPHLAAAEAQALVAGQAPLEDVAAPRLIELTVAVAGDMAQRWWALPLHGPAWPAVASLALPPTAVHRVALAVRAARAAAQQGEPLDVVGGPFAHVTPSHDPRPIVVEAAALRLLMADPVRIAHHTVVEHTPDGACVGSDSRVFWVAWAPEASPVGPDLDALCLRSPRSITAAQHLAAVDPAHARSGSGVIAGEMLPPMTAELKERVAPALRSELFGDL